jgi:hypothetical protein
MSGMKTRICGGLLQEKGCDGMGLGEVFVSLFFFGRFDVGTGMS